MGRFLRVLGGGLAIAGAVALASIFAVVLIMGSWPSAFEPIRVLFEEIASLFGDAALFVEGVIFIGPGLLLYWVGGAAEDDYRQDNPIP